MALFFYSHPMTRDYFQKPGKSFARCKMKSLSGQARSGQVWSGQAMQSYLDLKIHIQHSACYTEAAYLISCQSGHRARSDYCRYTIASGHLPIFAIYLHIETGISKSYKVPAILFGTLHDDVLPMICAKYY